MCKWNTQLVSCSVHWICSWCALHCFKFQCLNQTQVHRAQAHTVSTTQIDNNRRTGFCNGVGAGPQDTFCNHSCSLTRNAWYNTTSRVVYSKNRVKNFAFLKILKFGCFRTGIFTDFEIRDVFQRTGLFWKSKTQTKFGFFLSEKLDPENAYEPHIDIHNKSLFFWRGSVTIKVTNFHPPVKTLVPNSCLKLNSILYKSQNREANEGRQWAPCRCWGNRCNVGVCKFFWLSNPW